MSAAERWAGIRRHLQYWRQKCPVCMWQGRLTMAEEYRLGDCRERDSVEARSRFKTITKEIVYEAYTVCYGCGSL